MNQGYDSRDYCAMCGEAWDDCSERMGDLCRDCLEAYEAEVASEVAATSQVLPATRPHPETGLSILPGARFGKLTLVGYIESTQRGHRYLCVCDCGHFAARHGAHLRRCHTHGVVSSCLNCSRQHRTSWLSKRKRMRSEGIRSLWHQHHTLYGLSWNETEAGKIRDEIAAMGIDPGGRASEIDMVALREGHTRLTDVWATSSGGYIDDGDTGPDSES